MFIVATVGWVLDVSLFEQQKPCAIYVENVLGRCYLVGPDVSLPE
jgi:hypothetical protein